MPWARMFVSCHVKKLGAVYSVTMCYSWYGVYNFTETELFESKSDAEAWILLQRCEGRIVMPQD